MHLAAFNGAKSACSLLITKTNVNSTNKDGETPLDEAILLGRADVARLLLENGANINKNLILLRFEIIRKQQEVLELLLEFFQNKKT